MTAAFSLILSFYILLLVVFLIGWVRIRRQVMPGRSPDPPAVSVVVAVRNEEDCINAVMSDLSGMAFSTERFEVIIVNDHSTDNTADIARQFMGGLPNWRLLELPLGLEGKKAALQMGIEHARFGIVATTDADCALSKNWLTCVSSYFESADTKMLVGAVKLVGDHSFFSRLQVMEFLSLVGSTASSVGLGHPMMCNGANLAFRKDMFTEVGGYDGNLGIASGDDEFLMRKIFSRYPDGIRFMNYYEAVVSTRVQNTVHDFFHQRLRWAGKWKHNTDHVTQLSAVLILVAQVAFLMLLIGNVVTPGITIGLVIAKVSLEGIFIFWIGRFLVRRFDPLAFMTLQLIYPMYVAGVGLFSIFSTYAWKSRNYK